MLLVFFLWVPAARADLSVVDTTGPCAKRDARLQDKVPGRGDRDFDGISNCTERKVLGTSVRDPDTDGDGLDDGDEVLAGTDPLDMDSDDDGLMDGTEMDLGTDPLDMDSDDDGMDDGSDPDPMDDLHEEIRGPVDALDCAGGQITVIGTAIALVSTTTYDGAESCADLDARIAQNGGAFVEVDVVGDGAGGFTATKVDLKDADNDGSPDRVDVDDDNDGTPDVDDPDDDGDGMPDVMDDDVADD